MASGDGVVEVDVVYVDAAEVDEEVEHVEEGTEDESESDEEEENDQEEGGLEHYFSDVAVPVRFRDVDGSVQPPNEDDRHAEVEVLGLSAREASQRVDGETLVAVDQRRPAGRGKGSREKDTVESIDADMDTSVPHCPICMERWTGQGAHRVCCIPCGHVYGRLCLENWVRRCGDNAKCPQCKRRFKVKDIINLYAPQITVINDDLEKEVNILREKNEILNIERKKLLEEVRRLKEDDMRELYPGKLKKQCLSQIFPRATDMRSSKLINDSYFQDMQTISGTDFTAQQPSPPTAFVLQDELAFDGARTLDIDFSSQIILVSGKTPGSTGAHILTKISVLSPAAMQNVKLPNETGLIKDLHFAPSNTVLPGRLALLASLGKKLSIFSMESNNVVLTYNLPGPAWSCSWDTNTPYQIYAGLSDGRLLVFDVRQTTNLLESKAGLSRHPVHTIHSLSPNGTHNDRMLLTACSVGLCLWNVGCRGTSPMLVPETENLGVCISLAQTSSSADIVASYRPKVEINCDPAASHPSPSLSPLTGPVRLGTHVSLKRIDCTNYQKRDITSGYVSDVRMSRSAIIPTEGSDALFAYGDEAVSGLCIWELASFRILRRLKPHPSPILDIKYSNSMSQGFLACLSEKRLQVFRVSPEF